MTPATLCRNFTDIAQPCCAAGVNYLALAGGGIYTMVLRLPCLPITDRRGFEVRACGQFKNDAGINQ